MTKIISSTQNPFIKNILQLKDKSKERKKQNKFILEGKRELSLAIKGGYRIETLLYYPELFSKSEAISMEHHGVKTVEISQIVFHKIAHRNTTEGIIAIVSSKAHQLADLQFKTHNPLILVAESLEKPGNVGAILRTADAANVDAVIIANPVSDLYNPNIVRSSVGCVFTAQIAIASTQDCIAFLKEHNIGIYSAILQESQPYHEQDYTDASAVVVGTEASGLTQEWRDASKAHINIPMGGIIDSMNVSVAAGILIFEAKRQREFN